MAIFDHSRQHVDATRERVEGGLAYFFKVGRLGMVGASGPPRIE
jgi:hypothetical protein